MVDNEVIVKMLLDHDSDGNTIGKNGGAALMKVAGEGHVAVVKMLLEHGADLDSCAFY